MQGVAVGAGPEIAAVGCSAEGPAAFVGEPVVERAEPGGVVEVGGSVVTAEADVVQLHGWVAAAEEHAPAVVAQVGAASDRGGELVVGDTDVEHVAATAEDGGDELGVAGEASRGVGADRRSAGQGDQGVAEPSFQDVEVDGDDYGAGAPVNDGVCWAR